LAVAFKAAKIGESVFAGQSEILTREVARVDVSTDEEALATRRLWKTWDAMRIYTFLIRTIQIANKSMTLGAASDYYILKRAQTCIIFSRLVLTVGDAVKLLREERDWRQNFFLSPSERGVQATMEPPVYLLVTT